jgi:hypothetical protein
VTHTRGLQVVESIHLHSHFSTFQANYEENIIKECFGVHRTEEYAGRNKLDAVIIYGCAPRILQRVSLVCIPTLPVLDFLNSVYLYVQSLSGTWGSGHGKNGDSGNV